MPPSSPPVDLVVGRRRSVRRVRGRRPVGMAPAPAEAAASGSSRRCAGNARPADYLPPGPLGGLPGMTAETGPRRRPRVRRIGRAHPGGRLNTSLQPDDLTGAPGGDRRALVADAAVVYAGGGGRSSDRERLTLGRVPSWRWANARVKNRPLTAQIFTRRRPGLAAASLTRGGPP